MSPKQQALAVRLLARWAKYTEDYTAEGQPHGSKLRDETVSFLEHADDPDPAPEAKKKSE